MKRMRRVRVYRVVSMIEMDIMTTSVSEACQAGLDIAVKPETAFQRPDCKFVATVQNPKGGTHAKAPASHPKAR
jgi:hypothetical protein